MAAGGCWFCAFVVQLRSVAFLYVSNEIPVVYDRVCNEESNRDPVSTGGSLTAENPPCKESKGCGHVSNIDRSIAMKRCFRTTLHLATRITTALK